MSIHTDLDQIFPIKTFLTFSFNIGVTCAVQTVLTFSYYYLFRFCLANFGGLYLFLYSLWLFMGQYQTFLIYLNTFWTTMPYRNIKVLHTFKTDKVTFQELRSWFSIREARRRYFTCDDDDDDDGKIKYFSRGVLDSEKKKLKKTTRRIFTHMNLPLSPCPDLLPCSVSQMHSSPGHWWRKDKVQDVNTANDTGICFCFYGHSSITCRTALAPRDS